jgi:hypothetical protein
VTTEKDKTSWLVASGPGLVLTLILGAGLGYLFVGDLFNRPPHELMAPAALGLVWAVLLLQWVDLVVQSLALSSRLVPDELDFLDREAIAAHGHTISGGQMLRSRARNLLAAWGAGASPAQVIALAAYQSDRCRHPLRAATAFGVILLAGALWLGTHTVLAWGAFVVLAITVLARQNLLGRVDQYIETKVLSRLPGAEATAGVTATAGLGESVERAFQTYIPQPEKMAESINEAIRSAGTGLSEQIGGALAEHGDTLRSASQQLSSQLDRIAELQQNIEKLLHVQEAVEGVMKSVSASQEFTETLGALRNHVEETDKVLRQLSKPRRIRLVETPPAKTGAAPAKVSAPPPDEVEVPSLREADTES